MSLARSLPPRRRLLALGALVAAAGLAACQDAATGPSSRPAPPVAAAPGQPPVLTALDCAVKPREASVRCAPATALPAGVRAAVLGAQGVNVALDATNASYDPIQGRLTVDVSVRNVLNESIGTPDGTTPDADGIRVFFSATPQVTAGTGTVTVENYTGMGAFTASNQPYYAYAQVLGHNQSTSPMTWSFDVPPGVTAFTFRAWVAAETQPMLVINEFLTNPGGAIMDNYGEWFELYNAGSLPVELAGLLIADSAASGRRPYHLIAPAGGSLVVPPGGYVTMGNSSNTALNGGVALDYAYGANGVAPLAFANSLDAVKISRVVGADTLTIDYARYASAAISAQNGISRELRNPLLDNLSMDGSNWADALVTAVYGPGGRGTPKAQNSTYVP